MLTAKNKRGNEITEQIRTKIKQGSSEGFLHFICPNSKTWDTEKNDITFGNIKLVDDDGYTITLEFDTYWKAPLWAMREFLENLTIESNTSNSMNVLNICLQYVDTTGDFIGFYYDGEEDSTSLYNLYEGLVRDEPWAEDFSNRMGVDLYYLARNYLCFKAMNNNNSEECSCALCEHSSDNECNDTP